MPFVGRGHAPCLKIRFLAWGNLASDLTHQDLVISQKNVAVYSSVGNMAMRREKSERPHGTGRVGEEVIHEDNEDFPGVGDVCVRAEEK